MEASQIERIYDEILQMGIELEPDPTVLGPRYLNEVVSRCRNFMNRVTIILLELQREKRTLTKALAGEEASYKIEFDQILAENDAIKRLPNIKDRESSANVLLATRRRTISDLEMQILDLETVEKTVKLRHQELIRTSDNIRIQRSLLFADRTTGSGYGDEYDGPRDAKGRPLPSDGGIDENELDRLLADSTAEVAAGAQTTSTPEPVQAAPEPTQKAPEPAQKVPEPPPPPPASEPVQTAPEPTPAPEPVQAAPEPTQVVSETAPIQAAPEPTVVQTPTTDAGLDEDVAKFLSNVDGEEKKPSQKTSKKKEEAPKPPKAPPSSGEDFDFSDLLKNL